VPKLFASILDNMAGKYFKEPIVVKSYTKVSNTSGGITKGDLTDIYTTTATVRASSLRRTNDDESISFVSGYSIEFFRNPSVDISVGDVISYDNKTLVINRLRLEDRGIKFLIEATAKV
jgi:hypothetical protein